MKHQLLLKGRVIQGEGQGRRLGYPTANLDRRYFARHPIPNGVWVCRVRITRTGRYNGTKRGKWLHGIAVTGMNDEKRGGGKIEIHVLDFKKNIYEWYCEAMIVKKIRLLKKYKNNTLMEEQIRKDIMYARKILQ